MTLVEGRIAHKSSSGEYGNEIRTCCISLEPLDSPFRRLQLQTRCGHHLHYTCLRGLLENRTSRELEEDLFCKHCGARGQAFVDVAEIICLHQEASAEIQKDAPTDIELLVHLELRRFRPTVMFRELPRTILHFSGLRSLEISGHPISALPAAIENLWSLKRLSLISLNLKELPDEVCNLTRLNHFYSCGGYLRRLPSQLHRLANLWDCCFDGNIIESIPELWPPLIEGMKICGNRLEELPDTFATCKSVKSVRALGNSLRKLPDSVCCQKDMIDLILQGNKLCRLPEDLGSLSSLRYLLVSDNCLEVLPDSLCNLVKLNWLYVYNNRLRSLPVGLLKKMTSLERLLIEANPLSGESIQDTLSNVPPDLRALGMDTQQLSSWYGMGHSGTDIPSCVCVGRMMPWGSLYAKLTPASQLRKFAAEAFERPSPASGDVLVVAFSASQGEPEWLGVLGKLLSISQDFDKGPHAFVTRESRGSLGDLCNEVRERRQKSGVSSGPACKTDAAAVLWEDYCHGYTTQVTTEGKALQDFDVLCLCETGMQWYSDTDARTLGVEEKLSSLVSNYRHVLFLGASMGGFGALSYSHLADTVVVFGPQTDLCRSHLRPGAACAQELIGRSNSMCEGVKKALARGTRIEYHVSLEEHLLYARYLPLPPGGLIIHPVYGRIARLLEGANVLALLLIDYVSELQDDNCIRPLPSSVEFASKGFPFEEEVVGHDWNLVLSPRAWDWSDDKHATLAIAKWELNGSMSQFWMTPFQLRDLCSDPVRKGDWICENCGTRNTLLMPYCGQCLVGKPPEHGIAQPWKFTRNFGDYDLASVRKCDCGSKVVDGSADPVTSRWYCNKCWNAFARHNQTMKDQLPRLWYVEKGQRWSWVVEGRSRGFIEFAQRGVLHGWKGDGSWHVSGFDMIVEFGNPRERYRLVRCSRGFRATTLSTSGEVQLVQIEGMPLDGLVCSAGAACWIFEASLATCKASSRVLRFSQFIELLRLNARLRGLLALAFLTLLGGAGLFMRRRLRLEALRRKLSSR